MMLRDISVRYDSIDRWEMRKWEYAVIVADDRKFKWLDSKGEAESKTNTLVSALNAIGREGWEIITSQTTSHGSNYWSFGAVVYTLKRPVE
jgi:hypothetical protein